MGEIGIQLREYLYKLTFCDLLLIQRGYDARARHLWSATRWQTFYLMSAFAGSKGMKDAGINSPVDLMEFPWEKDIAPAITQNEVDEMLADIDAINAMNAVNP